MKRISLFSVLFIVSYFSLISQSNSDIKGIWLSPNELTTQTFQWQAQWIWLDKENESDVMLARRSFDFRQIPNQAQLRITATSQYQLYINGK